MTLGLNVGMATPHRPGFTTKTQRTQRNTEEGRKSSEFPTLFFFLVFLCALCVFVVNRLFVNKKALAPAPGLCSRATWVPQAGSAVGLESTPSSRFDRLMDS